MIARRDSDDNEHPEPLHELEAMFAGTSSPSANAGPSRSDVGNNPQQRDFSESRRPHIHKRRIKHRQDDVRQDIVKLLKDIEDRLAAEIARADAAELRSREAEARTAALKVGQRTLEAKTKAAQEAVLVCQTELRNARVQLQAGQAEIQRLELERNDAEASAARARSTARKATELLNAENAREEGRREGIAIGRDEGMRFARVQGWSGDELQDRSVEGPRAPSAPRVAPLPAEIDRSSPEHTGRPTRQPSGNSDPTRRRVRPRPPVQPIFETQPPAKPDVAAMAETIPRQTVTTPAPEPAVPAAFSPRSNIRSPQHTRGRSGSIAGRNISAPIPIPSRPVTPSPGPPAEHAPVPALPDTYIPTFDQESEVPFPLPPPHELSGIPTTPSVSSRAPLPPTSPPIPGPGHVFTGSGPAAATQAARAVTRGIKSLFRSKRASATTAITDLSLLREPRQVGRVEQAPDVEPSNRRPTMSVIVGDSNVYDRITRRPSRSSIPPPRPIFSTSDQPFSPTSQYGSREPDISPVDVGHTQWNSEQTHRRMMADELRNSDPEADMRSLRSGSRPSESVRGAGYASYHRFNRTKPQMPKPLAPSTDRSVDEQYGTSASMSGSRAPSEIHRTPALSVSSFGASSTYRKAPPNMPTPIIAVQPPTRGNSFQPPSASIIYSPPGHTLTPQPHPISPIGSPSVNIVSPKPTHARRASGPSITVTGPQSTTAQSAHRLEDSDHRPLRRQSSTSSIGSVASSVHSRRSAYKTFDKSSYIDPAFMATADANHNPLARYRPLSPMGSHQDF